MRGALHLGRDKAEERCEVRVWYLRDEEGYTDVGNGLVGFAGKGRVRAEAEGHDEGFEVVGGRVRQFGKNVLRRDVEIEVKGVEGVC